MAVEKNCTTDSPYVREARVIVGIYAIPVLVISWIAATLALVGMETDGERMKDWIVQRPEEDGR